MIHTRFLLRCSSGALTIVANVRSAIKDANAGDVKIIRMYPAR